MRPVVDPKNPLQFLIKSIKFIYGKENWKTPKKTDGQHIQDLLDL